MSTVKKDSEDRVERELKFVGVELDALRQRLIELEADRRWPGSLEDNWMFDRAGELASADCTLRLRKDTRGAWITFKGPVAFEGQTKVRVEHESEISDPVEMRRLIESLGYRLTRRYQKIREQWQLGGVAIALDHTPIGDFAEFEGDAAEALARRFGFNPERAERRSYLKLYDDYLAEHPEAPPDMVFPD